MKKGRRGACISRRGGGSRTLSGRAKIPGPVLVGVEGERMEGEIRGEGGEFRIGELVVIFHGIVEVLGEQGNLRNHLGIIKNSSEF